MAKGRVGGTKAKIRGQVGNIIYQIRGEGDGTYKQIVMEKGERTETTESELLQAQRMCTAMVQAFIRDMKSVGQISIQGAKTMTESLNTLSSLNLKTVKEDCKVHWYDHGDFYFPRMDNKGSITEQVGGMYYVSQGTLSEDLFDSAGADDKPYFHYRDVFTAQDQFYAVRFNKGSSPITVGEFLRSHRMTRKDKVCIAIFHEWTLPMNEDEEYESQTKQDWIIAGINPQVADSEILDANVIPRLFISESSLVATTAVSVNGEYFGLGFKINVVEHDDNVAFFTAFSISFWTGKKSVKTARMYDPLGNSEAYLYYARPTNVFYSWMRAAYDTEWPSPWG